VTRLLGAVIAWCARHRWTVVTTTLAATVAAFYAMRAVPVDAIPDLSDPQVIVFTEWMGRSPTLVEDQVTYPIASSLLAAPTKAPTSTGPGRASSNIYRPSRSGCPPA
jgi:copper/silver efflux system protein